MQVQELQALATKLQALPARVVWDTSEAVSNFQATLGELESAKDTSDYVVEVVLEYIFDPLLGREHFLEWIVIIFRDYGVFESGVRLAQFTQAVEALGLSVVASMRALGLVRPGERALWRFESMLGSDAVLRKATQEDLIDAHAERWLGGR